LGVDPGGEIMIHGLAAKYAYLGAFHRATDWTEGCIAVTNAEIDEIFKLVPVGTPVEIRP
jgi:murein L,D-transpeptidase YafK